MCVCIYIYIYVCVCVLHWYVYIYMNIENKTECIVGLSSNSRVSSCANTTPLHRWVSVTVTGLAISSPRLLIAKIWWRTRWHTWLRHDPAPELGGIFSCGVFLYGANNLGWVYPSIHLSVCLSVCLSVYLSICLSIYPSVCVSVYLIQSNPIQHNIIQYNIIHLSTNNRAK